MLMILCGLSVGLLLGLTGGGGGIVALPVLMVCLGYSFDEAKTIALFAIALSATWGAIQGLKQSIIRYRAALYMAFTGLCTIPIGLALANVIPLNFVLVIFISFLIYSSIQMWLKANKSTSPSLLSQSVPCQLNAITGRICWTKPCFKKMSLLGGSSGMLSGLLGIGGGIVIVPGLKSMSDIDLRSIVATSLMVVALISILTLTVMQYQGLHLVASSYPFIGMTLIGLLLGRKMINAIPTSILQRLCACLMLIAAFMMLKQYFYLNDIKALL